MSEMEHKMAQIIAIIVVACDMVAYLVDIFSGDLGLSYPIRHVCGKRV
jgi:hypothetical protein